MRKAVIRLTNSRGWYVFWVCVAFVVAAYLAWALWNAPPWMTTSRP